MKPMTLKEAIKIAADHQAWRRWTGDMPMKMPHSPQVFGKALDIVIDAAMSQIRHPKRRPRGGLQNLKR